MPCKSLPRSLFALAALGIGLLASPAALAIDVRICTSLGAIEVELDDRNAPLHASNFARYAETGFYSGTVIHRVVPGAMVQGGGYDRSLQRRRPTDPVRNESFGALSNRRGTIAASRSEDPDSATSQFFFNLTDNSHLDANANVAGYTVFGRVTAGIELLDEIAALPSRTAGELNEVPDPLIEIESVVALERAAFFGLSVEQDPAVLQDEFVAARNQPDPAVVLAAVDALRRGCVRLDPAQHIAEAEAAIELGLIDRARYGLEQYLARASALDRELAAAQRLLASLPVVERNDIDALIAHCNRPSAPSIPNGRFAELGTLQAIESAVLRYRQLGRLYLTCISQVIDGDRLNDAEAIDATERHNEMVIELTGVMMRFNRAVLDFKQEQEAVLR